MEVISCPTPLFHEGPSGINELGPMQPRTLHWHSLCSVMEGGRATVVEWTNSCLIDSRQHSFVF